MTEPLAVIAGQGIAVHGFDGGQFELGFVIFAAAGGQAEQAPVGGPVTGSGESFGIDKGFKPEDRMMVHPLPIQGNGFGNAAQQSVRRDAALLPMVK